MDEKTTIIVAAVLLGVGCFVAAVFLVGRIAAHLTGWTRLARTFPAGAREMRGDRWSFQSLRLNQWGGYNNCVTIGADPEGLYLVMPWILRQGHEPVFIPWREIARATPQQRFLWRGVTLEMPKLPDLTITVGERVAEALRRQYPLKIAA
jgi:hypothetical protein